MTGHFDDSVAWSAFQHLVMMARVSALVFAAAIGTQCIDGEVHAGDDADVEISVKAPQPDAPIAHQLANSPSQDPSEDLISGLRSVLRSGRSSYGRGPGNLRFRRSAETSNALRSISRTRKNLRRSMRSITNSVRSMNTSINRIRTYRRRF